MKKFTAKEFEEQIEITNKICDDHFGDNSYSVAFMTTLLSNILAQMPKNQQAEVMTVLCRTGHKYSNITI